MTDDETDTSEEEIMVVHIPKPRPRPKPRPQYIDFQRDYSQTQIEDVPEVHKSDGEEESELVLQPDIPADEIVQSSPVLDLDENYTSLSVCSLRHSSLLTSIRNKLSSSCYRVNKQKRYTQDTLVHGTIQ